MFQRVKQGITGLAVAAILTAAGNAAHAAPINITIDNATGTGLSMYSFGPNAPGYVNVAFGGGGDVTPTSTTFTVDDGDEFALDGFIFNTRYGHTFHITAGAIVADNVLAYTPAEGITNQFFQVSGTTISLTGRKFIGRLLTQPGGPGYQYIYGNAAIGLPGAYAYIGGPDNQTIVLPDDGLFSGQYNITMGAPNDASVVATLQSGPMGGISSVTGAGTSWAPIDSESGVLTLTGGAFPGEQVYLYLQAPEPASLGILSVGAAMLFRRRRSR